MKGIAVLLIATVVVSSAKQQCPSDWDEDRLLVHEDCNKFYKCTYGEKIELECPLNLHFNIENGQCDWIEIVDCSDRNDPTAPETTTKKVTEATTLKPASTEAATLSPAKPTTEKLPASTEAATLSPAKPTTEKLPASTEAATLGPANPRPTTESVPEPKPESAENEWLENGCPVDPHVHWLLPHEEDCNSFYYCVWGEKVLKACPATLHFNRIKQVCDWAWDAGCPVSANKHLEGRKALKYRLV